MEIYNNHTMYAYSSDIQSSGHRDLELGGRGSLTGLDGTGLNGTGDDWTGEDWTGTRPV